MRIWARRLRAEPFALLAALWLCLLGAAAPARAADDGPIVSHQASINLELDVVLNGAPRNLISMFRADADGQVIGATARELAEIGFEPRLLSERPDGLVHLADLPGLKFRYDEPEQRIILDAPPRLLATTHLSVAGADGPRQTAPPVTGAVVNYTLFASAGQSGGRIRLDSVSAELEGRIFGRFGVVSSSAVVTTGPYIASEAVRLDTNWRYDRPDKLISYQAGDFINRGLTWTRPVRLGGLQVARSFALRPDLITTPTPVLTGTAAAPSTLDLYINNVKQLSTDIPAGPFEISRAPVAYGAGLAQVVVRDAVGRDMRIDAPFYVSEALLAPGLADYALEVGYARRNYGILSNDYDRRLAASGSLRFGLNRSLTLEGHFESGGSLFNGGGGAVFGLGRWAVASAAVSYSRTSSGEGGLIDLSVESRQRLFSVSLRSQRTFGDYEDLASYTAARGPPVVVADPLLVSTLGAPAITPSDPLYAAAFRAPRALDQAVLSFPVWRDHTRLNLSFARVDREGDRTRLVGLSLSHDFRRASLYLRALHDFDSSQGTSVAIGLTFPFGAKASVSAEVQSDDGRASVVAEASSRTVDSPGAVGWRLRLSDGEVQDRLASVSYVSPWGRAEGGLQQLQGRWGGYGQFAGGFAWVAGQPFLSRRLDGPFAVVQAGEAGLPVRFENRYAGRTGANGALLVPNLVAYQPNRISIDAALLPVDRDVPTDTAMIAPASGAAALVRLGTTILPSALVVLVGPDGEPLAAGSEGEVEGAPGAFFVGYDGEAYLTGLKPRNAVTIRTPEGRSCQARFDYRAVKGKQTRIGPVRCLPVFDASKPGASSPDKLAAR